MSRTGQTFAPINRELGYTEQNWCRAVSTGTGVSVIGIHLSNQMPETSDLHKILNALRESHPLLSSKIHHDTASKTYSLRTSPAASFPGIIIHDAPATLQLLRSNNSPRISPLHKILEREINSKIRSDANPLSREGVDVFSGSVYVLSESERVLVVHIHPVAFDRISVLSLLRELMEAVAEGSGGGGEKRRLNNKGEGEMSLESLVPNRFKKKGMWSHGKDMLSYTLGSTRNVNLEFKSKGLPTSSEIVKLQINPQITAKILAGCESRGIKLFGALASAALLAAHSSSTKGVKKKYGVVTITDCRKSLETSPSPDQYGFYQSMILATHTIKGTELFWDLATTFYVDFARNKTNNKHLTDMTDLNFLMSKTIDSPGLTPSAFFRTSLLAVFEDTVYESIENHKKIGVVDYMGCGSNHGLGPSMGILDAIRDGKIHCDIVYPVPLHSRAQMEEVVEKMTVILVDGSKQVKDM